MEKLLFITINENKTSYWIYTIKVQRGIRGKTRSKVDELIIVGKPKEATKKDLKKMFNIDVDQISVPAKININ